VFDGRLFQVVALFDKAAVPTDLWQAEDGSLLVTTDRGVFRMTLDELNKSRLND
jgi:glucose/arabinose dehydrogenase